MHPGCMSVRSEQERGDQREKERVGVGGEGDGVREGGSGLTSQE